jgi:putative tryptophan/tyrosine transport system substrate-binding protein
MRRRDFTTGLILAAAARSARAQQPTMPVIGLLSPGSPEDAAAVSYVAAFRQGLAAAGYAEGRNVAIEYRWARGEYDRFPALAADLVAAKVPVVFAGAINSALAAKAATATVPIVFVVGTDPIASGLVTSLSRPGGNLTGAAVMLGELWPKRLQLLHELLPQAGTIGVLINPENRNAASNTRTIEAAAKSLGLSLEVLEARTEREIDAAFGPMQQHRLDALLIGDDPFFGGHGPQLIGLATRYRLPTIYPYRAHVALGGLLSYGASIASMYRLAGEYTARILNGAKPGDLPVQQPTEFDLVINLKTAGTLGLTVPQALLAQAVEVIE